MADEENEQSSSTNKNTEEAPVVSEESIAEAPMPEKAEEAAKVLEEAPKEEKKASKEVSGYVVGVAMKDFKSGEGENIDYAEFQNSQPRKISSGQIPIAIRIEYAEISSSRNANALLSRLNSALFTNVQDPEKFVNVIRFIASGITIIISMLVGLFILARILPKAIEGIGRNPLARRSILFYTGINIVIVIVIILFGIGAALLLVRV